MSCTIIFFFRSRKLMLLDDIIQIIINSKAGNKACLGSAVHDLAVDIITVSVIDCENSFFDVFLDQSSRLFIDLVVVHIGVFRESCLRSYNLKERHRIFKDKLSRFLLGINIIRKGRNFLYIFWLRPDGLKRFDCYHRFTFLFHNNKLQVCQYIAHLQSQFKYYLQITLTLSTPSSALILSSAPSAFATSNME